MVFLPVQTFAQRVLGVMAWVVPVAVAVSCFGSTNGIFLSASRVTFVGARDGYLPDLLAMIHRAPNSKGAKSAVSDCLLVFRVTFVGARDGYLPDLLAMIHVSLLTPLPAVALLCPIALLMLTSNDVYRLINFLSAVRWLFIGLATATVPYLRWRRPDMHRPFKCSAPRTGVFDCVWMVFSTKDRCVYLCVDGVQHQGQANLTVCGWCSAPRIGMFVCVWMVFSTKDRRVCAWMVFSTKDRYVHVCVWKVFSTKDRYVCLCLDGVQHQGQVPLILPIIFTLVCAVVVAMSLYSAPVDVGIGLALTLTGVPVYVLAVWKNKPEWLRRFTDSATRVLQSILLVVPQEAPSSTPKTQQETSKTQAEQLDATSVSTYL
ncbi:hypothetical protein Bbelb_008820 [Branchiostoma belcheri]|nr:hypothetical protein Bbelb_008820 [Branchiostoma belcheri]